LRFLTASFALLFAVSGVLLWYGERNNSFRFASTILLHDGLMYVSIVLVAGHLYLAVIHPATRHSLQGMDDRLRPHELGARAPPKWVDKRYPPSE